MQTQVPTYTLRKGGPAITLEREERSMPTVGPNDVIVRVGAASLNYRDLLVLQGKAGDIKDALIPVSDVAGVVIEIGDAVTKWKVGDRVAAPFFPEWKEGSFKKQYLACPVGAGQRDGYLSERIKIDEGHLVHVPPHLSLTEAAALPCAGVTAWHALVDRGNINEGDTVLIIGTGGVAVMALQIASSLGAKPIVLSSSDDKLERIRHLGVWESVNYIKSPDWEREVLKITNGEGVRHVLELGGPATFDKSMTSVSAGGNIYQIGVLSGFDLRPNLLSLQFANANVLGVCVGSVRHFNELNAFLSKTQIKPFIDSTFRFDQVREAYHHLGAGKHIGKVTVVLND